MVSYNLDPKTYFTVLCVIIRNHVLLPFACWGIEFQQASALWRPLQEGGSQHVLCWVSRSCCSRCREAGWKQSAARTHKGRGGGHCIHQVCHTDPDCPQSRPSFKVGSLWAGRSNVLKHPIPVKASHTAAGNVKLCPAQYFYTFFFFFAKWFLKSYKVYFAYLTSYLQLCMIDPECWFTCFYFAFIFGVFHQYYTHASVTLWTIRTVVNFISGLHCINVNIAISRENMNSSIYVRRYSSVCDLRQISMLPIHLPDWNITF